MGVGLDAHGNFSNPTEGRGTSCTSKGPGQRPNAIAIRGPAPKTSGGAGYCWLAGASGVGLRGTGTIPTSGPTTSQGRRIQITISPAVKPLVTISMASSTTGTLQQILQHQMTEDAPASYKLGFAASTGTNTDTHLIRNVTVSTVNELQKLNLVKQIDRTLTQPVSYKEGDTIPYSFVATNPLPVTLTNLAIADPKIPAVSCPVTSLPPMVSTTCTGSYKVTASDAMDATGILTNVATATARNGAAGFTSNTATETAPITAPAPNLSLAKTATLTDGNANGLGDPGERIAYSFAATNTGNVSLTGVSVSDPKVTGITPSGLTLAPGATANFTAATYTITQADIDAGTPVRNTATVSGKTGSGTTVTSVAAVAQTPIGYFPAIALQKTGVPSPGATGKAGETVSYSFTVTNSGNVPLTSVAISDPLPGLSAISYGAWPGTAGILARGQSVSATASYVLKQSDVDAGQVVNMATAAGAPPTGPAVSKTASHTLPVNRAPEISLTKTASPASIIASGDRITYSFKVTNTGNVTLTGVAVEDRLPLLSILTYGAWPGAAGVLAPGQTVTATANYTVSILNWPEILLAGQITNTATASGSPPTGPRVLDSDTVVVPLRPDPKPDTVTVVQGESVTFNVLSNDAAAATGATFSRAQLASAPQSIGGAAVPVPASVTQGSVSCVGTGAGRGTCTYQSLDYFTGEDGFDYSLQQAAQGWNQTWNVHVTVTVLPKNHAPVARADRAVASAGGAAVTIEPLANDTDIDAGDALRITATGQPSDLRGTFTCGTNTCTYTPEKSAWTGQIQVPYTVSDQSGRSPGALTAAGTIKIFVDPPLLNPQGFHDYTGADQPASLAGWSETTTVAAPTATCTANRPTAAVSWQARTGTTSWVLERRLAGTSPGPWITAAHLSGNTTSYTDARVGEGQAYQYRLRPDLHRWTGTFSSPSSSVTLPAAAGTVGC